MSGRPASFDYVAPMSLAEAVQVLADRPNSIATSGSYRLLIDLKTHRLEAGTLVDLRRVRELATLEASTSGLSIGGMVSLDQLARDDRVREWAPALAAAAAHTGDTQIRNMSAIGGVVAYEGASSDLAAALAVSDARLTLVGASGTRTLAAEEALAADAAAPLRRDEVVARVVLPRRSPTGGHDAYRHPASLRALVAVAADVEREPDGRVTRCALAVSGAVRGVVRLRASEEAIVGTRPGGSDLARALRLDHGVPWTPEAPGSADYRTARLRVLLERLLARLA